MRIEESVALGALLMLFERHHVHRAHGFELAAHLSIRLIASRQFVAGNEDQRRVGQQNWTLNAQFVQASVRHVRGIGLQFGGCGL